MLDIVTSIIEKFTPASSLKGKHMSNTVASITETEFQRLVTNGVTVVDFWAPWCGPCRLLGPILDEVVGEFKGKASLLKINIDDNHVLAEKFGIVSIPTILIFKSGKIVDKKVGGQSKLQLKKMIESAL